MLIECSMLSVDEMMLDGSRSESEVVWKGERQWD